MIQQLVSDAVNKVLADQSVTDKEKVSENIVSKVVEGLKPTLTPTIGRHIGVPQSISKPPCVYNPTPIAELKKRHIAVPVYNPMRESGVAVKRKTDDTAKPWLSCLPESIKTRPSEMTYKPTAIINSIDKDAVLNYVPTAKSDCLSLNSYDDSNSSDYSSSKSRKEAYYPKAKKRREEYVPKMIKPPLQSVQQLDEIILNEFQSEFDMLDDILISNTEKKSNQKTNQFNNDSFRDLSDAEAKFSDDDDDEIMNDMNSTKEVQKMHNEMDGNNSTRHLEEKENKTRDIKSYDSNNSSTNNKADTASSEDESKRINSESHKSNEKSKWSKSKSERSKREHGSSTSGSSSSKSRDRDKREHSRDKKDDGKHNSSSNDKRRSSTLSKHSGKSTSHRNKNKDNSSHSNKDKSRSSRDKNSSTNENNDKTHKSNSSSSSSSRHDKHASSKSKSDKKLSSKSTKSDSRSSSSHKTIKSREKTTTSKSESEHDDYSNSVFQNNFFNEELLQTSDSDHDVEEECLKIFQVN